jgi:hypothetical protein
MARRRTPTIEYAFEVLGQLSAEEQERLVQLACQDSTLPLHLFISQLCRGPVVNWLRMQEIALDKEKQLASRNRKPSRERIDRGAEIDRIKKTCSWPKVLLYVKENHPEWLSDYDLNTKEEKKRATEYLRGVCRNY